MNAESIVEGLKMVNCPLKGLFEEIKHKIPRYA